VRSPEEGFSTRVRPFHFQASHARHGGVRLCDLTSVYMTVCGGLWAVGCACGLWAVPVGCGERRRARSPTVSRVARFIIHPPRLGQGVSLSRFLFIAVEHWSKTQCLILSIFYLELDL